MSDFDKFINHLDASHDAVWMVARWLVSHGTQVTVNTTSKAKNRAECRDHMDNGDLYINQRVEVKGLSTEFTCAEDWPYKDWFMIVAKYKYDISNPKPIMFVYLNKARTHLAILKTDTYDQWRVRYNVKDRRYDNVVQDFYECPTKLVKFMPLEFKV